MKTFPVIIASLFIGLLPAFAEEVPDVDAAFPAMAARLSSAEARLPKKTIAVYGFEVIGRPGDSYAVYATEKLTHELVMLGKLLVLERSRLDEVLNEQNFSLTGAVDAGTAARIGKLLSVDAVVIGTIRVTRTRTEFIVRIIQSETGIILASADEYALADEEGGGDTATTDAGTKPRQTETPVKLTASKTRYTTAEQIVVIFAGLPGNERDWITLVDASKSDDVYGEYFYTDSQATGSCIFSPVTAGDYEVRAYFNWPDGGYVVQKRLKITVK
jgi:TolB-like protein